MDVFQYDFCLFFDHSFAAVVAHLITENIFLKKLPRKLEILGHRLGKARRYLREGRITFLLS